MKALKIFAAAVIATALFASCKSGNNDPKVDVQLPSAAQIDSVSYYVGFNFGYFIKMNGFGEDLNYGLIKQGMLDFINAKGSPNDENYNDQFKLDPDGMNAAFDAFISKLNEYKAAVNLKKGEDYLAANKMKDGVEVTESGLQYKILEEGNEVRATEADTVWVHYTGTTIDGQLFDKSNPEGEPVRLMLNRVIPGWAEGIQHVGEGGKIQLTIPANLAYGERAASPEIGPNSTLLFDVEVVKIGKAVVTEETAE